MSASPVSLQVSFQDDVVDDPRRTDAGCSGEHGRVAEIEDLYVIGLQPVERMLCRRHGVRSLGVCGTAGYESAWKHQRLLPLSLREKRVTGRQRQSVRVAN